MMQAIQIEKWLKEFQHELVPPVANKVLLENEDILVMAVGGPNSRLDFHYNETSEFFYQLKGTLTLVTQENGKRITHSIAPNSLFLLNPKVPHLPIRPKDSIGLVIELKRANTKDGILWFCPNCNTKIEEVYFKLNNIEKDFQAIFTKFYEDENARICPNCKEVHPIPQKVS